MDQLKYGRLGRLLAIAVLATLAIAAAQVVPAWIGAVVPPGYVDGRVVLFLRGVLAAYAVAAVVAAAGGAAALAALKFGATRTRRRRAAKALLLCGSIGVSLALAEASAVAWKTWRQRVPDLEAAAPPDAPDDPLAGVGAADETTDDPDRPLRILVLGESSARGEPYHDWLSIGQILAWELEDARPGRRVEVDMQAVPGATLEVMHDVLASYRKARPDLLLLYSGHNEFQSRFSWVRTVAHYDDDRPTIPGRSAFERLVQRSAVCRLVLDLIDRRAIPVAPNKAITRGVVDVPACTPAERDEVLRGFRRRLDSIAGFCARNAIVPVFVVPSSNDRDFDPSRSVVDPKTPPDARDAFARSVLEARALAATDPAAARERLAALIASQPTYAEAHFRLAKLLEAAGDDAGARRHYIEARERDGMPIRCPEAFRDAYRAVGRAFPGVILVDGDAVLSPLAPGGVLGDHQFHDAHHPTLVSYVALAQAALDAIAARGALGWPSGTPAPRIDPDTVANRAGLDRDRWATVLERCRLFYERTAYMGFDPSDRLARERAFAEARRRVAAGADPSETGVPGVGTAPTDPDG